MRRFNGWEPTQTHQHFDADGNLTGTTVVTPESEWSDDDRDWATGLLRYESEIEPGCGTHRSHTERTDVGRVVERIPYKCLDCEAIEKVRAKFHSSQKHTDDSCDCDQQIFYVDRYVPLPEPKRKPKSQ